MNKDTIAQKQAFVDEITDQIKQSDSLVAVDYLGLNVAQVTDLRGQLREEGVAFRVLKNTMIRRALDQAGIEYDEAIFHGPTALAFSGEDVTAPARILKKFAKDAEALTVKGGFYNGAAMTLEEIDRFADLPGRDGVYSMLLSVLQAPIRNVAYAVKAVHDKLDEGGDAAAEPEA